MEKKVTAGSPISQNEENVKAFFRKNFDFGNSSLISQSDEKVKTFIEENSEVRIRRTPRMSRGIRNFFQSASYHKTLQMSRPFL